ncbi:MAG: hypothetical protein EXR92_06005 [Gemmatimonadetes bacterium]|nr:hypothetical protein [Gemmatimonadota bacterium]
MRRYILLVALAVAVPAGARAQQADSPGANGQAMAAVSKMQVDLFVVSHLNEADNELFQRNARDAFRLGLEDGGVTVDGRAPHMIVCEVLAREAGAGRVGYQYVTKFFHDEAPTPTVMPIPVLVWDAGGMATAIVVPQASFAPEAVGKSCTDGFSNEWRKWNPQP